MSAMNPPSTPKCEPRSSDVAPKGDGMLSPIGSLQKLLKGFCDPRKSTIDSDDEGDDDYGFYVNAAKPSPQRPSTPNTAPMTTNKTNDVHIDPITFDSKSATNFDKVLNSSPPVKDKAQTVIPTSPQVNDKEANITPSPEEQSSSTNNDVFTTRRVLFPKVNDRKATKEDTPQSEQIVDYGKMTEEDTLQPEEIVNDGKVTKEDVPQPEQIANDEKATKEEIVKIDNYSKEKDGKENLARSTLGTKTSLQHNAFGDQQRPRFRRVLLLTLINFLVLNITVYFLNKNSGKALKEFASRIRKSQDPISEATFLDSFYDNPEEALKKTYDETLLYIQESSINVLLDLGDKQNQILKVMSEYQDSFQNDQQYAGVRNMLEYAVDKTNLKYVQREYDDIVGKSGIGDTITKFYEESGLHQYVGMPTASKDFGIVVDVELMDAQSEISEEKDVENSVSVSATSIDEITAAKELSIKEEESEESHMNESEEALASDENSEITDRNVALGEETSEEPLNEEQSEDPNDEENKEDLGSEESVEEHLNVEQENTDRNEINEAVEYSENPSIEEQLEEPDVIENNHDTITAGRSSEEQLEDLELNEKKETVAQEEESEELIHSNSALEETAQEELLSGKQVDDVEHSEREEAQIHEEEPEGIIESNSAPEEIASEEKLEEEIVEDLDNNKVESEGDSEEAFDNKEAPDGGTPGEMLSEEQLEGEDINQSEALESEDEMEEATDNKAAPEDADSNEILAEDQPEDLEISEEDEVFAQDKNSVIGNEEIRSDESVADDQNEDLESNDNTNESLPLDEDTPLVDEQQEDLDPKDDIYQALPLDENSETASIQISVEEQVEEDLLTEEPHHDEDLDETIEQDKHSPTIIDDDESAAENKTISADEELSSEEVVGEHETNETTSIEPDFVGNCDFAAE